MAESSRASKSKHPVRDFFEFDEQTNKSTCNIGGCPESVVTVTGDHAGNLHRLLKRYHKKEASVVETAIKKAKTVHPEGVPVYFTKEQVIGALTTTTTTDGRPYSFIDDTGLRMLVDPILDAFEAAGQPFTVNKDIIKSAGDERCEEIKKETTALLKDRKISLQIDLATCENKNVPGIDAQFIENGAFIIRTLAMVNLNERSTGVNIAKNILKVLQSYGIKLQNVISITSDNGTNVTLAIKILRAYQNHSLDAFFEGDVDFIFEGDDLANFQEMILQNAQRIEYDCQDMLTHIPCSAHTVNLAIGNAVKECVEAKQTIDACRDYCKKLRTPNVIRIFQEARKNLALLDVPTRWSSLYEMLNRLIKLESFVTTLPIHHFDENNMNAGQWQEMKEIFNALKPAAILMKRLQNQHISLSDIYAFWTETQLSLEEQQYERADESCVFLDSLLKHLQLRFTRISNIPMVLAGLYLDPRYQLLLSEQNKEHAINVLVKLHLTNCNGTHLVPQSAQTSAPNLSSLEKFLRTEESNTAIGIVQPDLSGNIRKKLIDFDNIQRQPTTSSLLSFWEDKKKFDFDLYLLAQIVHAVPGTETKIERNFSHLKFILTRLRNRLTDCELEKILVIRLNTKN